MRHAARTAQPVDFLFTSTAVRYPAARGDADHAAPFPTGLDDARMRFYCQIVDYVEWSLEAFVDNLYFIGPLREPPKRVYELSGEMPADVGTRGEFAPEILYRWQQVPDRLDAVQGWLERFGFTDPICFTPVGDEGFALSFGSTAAANSMLDIGFGLSQVLPIIVQGLVTPVGGWLIIEQPEIHLNPNLQGVLAELLAELIERGIGVVVETHSEHLLLRLRRLLADNKVRAEDINLYFVEKDEVGSAVRKVPVDQRGYTGTEDWPVGFFGDALREALALAQAQSSGSG
jgi:hypothetical protein